MITTHKINMDLQIRNTAARLDMVQCDTHSRAVEITMTAGGEQWKPTAVDNVFLRYRKSDGTGGSYDTLPDGSRAWQLEENRLTVFLAPQVLTVPGIVEIQAALLRADACIATFGFQIAVEADPSAGAVESEDYINWTAWAQVELDKRLKQAEENGAFSGATFTPAVDSQGNLTWTNDRGAENPAPVNIVDLLYEKLDGETFLKASGDTMTGNLDMGGCWVRNLSEPSADGDAANKAYVDSCAAAVSSCYSITVPASGWAGETAPFSQMVSLAAIRETDCPHFGAVYSDDLQTALAQKAAFALVDDLQTGNGTVTLTCFGGKPEADLTIQMEVNR